MMMELIKIGQLTSLSPICLKLLSLASLRTGKIPNQWREAKVISLFKKGDNSLPSNYSPISLTCRILKSIIADSIKAHLVFIPLFLVVSMDF